MTDSVTLMALVIYTSGLFAYEVLSRVVFETSAQAASFFTPSTNLIPLTTSAICSAPFRARQRF